MPKVLQFLALATFFLMNVFATDELVKLTADNFALIKGPIDGPSVDQVVKDMYAIEGDTVYLYFDTPGGSVMDGNGIIDAMETLTHMGKDVICVADTAISMGFVIFQHCPVRYVRPRAVLMQHQMSLGVRGQLENLKSRLELVQSLDDQLSQVQAARLKLTVDEFKAKTNNDWWMYGKDVIENGAADDVVNVVCDFDYREETFVVDYMTMFGPVHVTFSKCPLIKQPLAVSFNEETQRKMNEANADPNTFAEHVREQLSQMDPLQSYDDFEHCSYKNMSS
jgi:ATP-dependent Clp protease, protease subunit